MSLIYTLIYLRSGRVLTLQDKIKYSPVELCSLADLPDFEEVIEEISGLKYDEEPHYSKIIFLFKKEQAIH